MENFQLASVDDALGGDEAVAMSHPLGEVVNNTQENNFAEVAEIVHAADGPDIVPESQVQEI